MANTRADKQDIFNAGLHELNAVLHKYPWFTTARIRRSVINSTTDPLLCLNLLTKPWPTVMLHDGGIPGPDQNVYAPERESRQNYPGEDVDRIIERFLESGEKRIVPSDDTPTDDVSQDSTVFVPDEDLDTEELERIYRDQGLALMDKDLAEITGEVLDIVTEE
ncbi:MAG: hypothetical protein LUF87_05480 [Alistipes sp.]|nr:hypothetical protein [Alistipes sp.]